MGDALHTGGTTAGGQGVTSAREARLAQAGLLAVQGPSVLDARTGVLLGPGSTALVTGTADTAPMAYSIAPHQWVTSRRSADGPYLGALDAVRKVATTAAPGSGSRIDVVWVRQSDNDPTVLTPDATTTDQYGVTQGQSSTGTPVKPDIPVGALELATVTVAAGATRTNGTGVTITNTARQTAPRGTPIPVRSQEERDALAVYDGLSVKRLDLGGVEQQRIAGTWMTVFDPASAQPRGRMGSNSFNTAGPTGVTGSETLFDGVTFTAAAGRRYRVSWDGVWVATGSPVTAAFTVRTAAGASVTNAGALHYSRTVRSLAFGEFLDKLISTEITGLAAGQTTVGIGVRVALGGGTITIPGSADNLRKILVEDIGS